MLFVVSRILRVYY